MTRRGLVLFAILSILWGVPYLMIKVAVEEVSVPFLVFARSTIGALALLPIALRQADRRQLITRWLPILGFSVTEMVLPWGLIAHGETSVDSSTAGLVIALTPVFTVLIVKMTGGSERIGGRRWLGLSLGFLGVAVLTSPGADGSALAIGEFLLAAVCYGIGSVIASRWLADIPAGALTTVCLLISALVYAGPAAVTRPSSMPSAAALSSIVGLGVFCTAIAFAVFFLLVREVGPARAVVITYVAPAVAVAAGTVFLSEPVGAYLFAALGLILGGSVLATAASAAPEPRLLVEEPQGSR